MSKLVLFGAGKIADEAYTYFTNDSPHEVVAFTVDGEFLTEREKLGLPVVAFEDVVECYPPDEFVMFVAVGYQDLNRFRAARCAAAEAKGYELVSYVSSRAANIGDVPVGRNCFILEFAVIQPWSRIGDDVFIWSANHVGHHAAVEDHCYVAGNVTISGSTVVEPYCFLGVGATVGHELRIGTGSFIGAAALITKDVAPGSVYIAPGTDRYRLDADAFLSLTKMR